MLDIPRVLSTELSLRPFQVANALELFADGATVPFIARYRKERTGEMTETQLRDLFDRFTYLTELEERKRAILESIAGQGKLTDELRRTIEACAQKTELEDLYLPFKPKRRTRATIARERGLEPLARFIEALNAPDAAPASIEAEAETYVSAERGVATTADAVAGASDILAEEVSERADLRAHIRDYLMAEGTFASRVKDDFPAGTTKFEMYRDFHVRVKDIAPHNTAVHPERYELVERIAADLGLEIAAITRAGDRLRALDVTRYVTADVGEPTLRDIVAELEKPGRDPRAEFRYATFSDAVTAIKDLRPGMELEGVVTNVANFGAFVDIGVHQDGLVHISQLADRFVDDPRTVVKVGQVVRVRVLEVNEALNRISLSMKSPRKDERASRPSPPPQPQYTVRDLMSKFNRKP